MNFVRVVGDVHGKYNEYLNIIWNAPYSIQVGDLGYNYEFLREVDHTKHIALAGNHENHPERVHYDHLLHSFGEYELGGLPFYYVNGAFSIDWKVREEKYFGGEWPRTWFKEEELTIPQLENAVSLYEKVRPAVMITHDCPRSISNMVGDPIFLKNWGYDPNRFTTRTSEALQVMFDGHKPKIWLFGHYHKKFDQVIEGTRFKCLPELGYIDLDPEEFKPRSRSY